MDIEKNVGLRGESVTSSIQPGSRSMSAVNEV